MLFIQYVAQHAVACSDLEGSFLEGGSELKGDVFVGFSACDFKFHLLC